MPVNQVLFKTLEEVAIKSSLESKLEEESLLSKGAHELKEKVGDGVLEKLLEERVKVLQEIKVSEIFL